MYGIRPSDKTANTSPRYLALASLVLPQPSSTSASDGPRAASTSAAGATTTDPSLTPVEKSARTRSNLRSDACELIRGSSAVITEMATIAYGSWKGSQAVWYAE